MTEKSSVFEIADKAVFAPVDRNSVAFSLGPNPPLENAIRNNALTFSANDLLGLTPDEIHELSRKIRNRFTNIASHHHIKVDADAMEYLKDGETNTLMHELAHFRVIKELRPEVADSAKVSLLPLIDPDARNLKIGIEVRYDNPKVPFTILERARVVLAPNRPSKGDYYELCAYIQSQGLGENRAAIFPLVNQKPNTSGKEKLLKLLKRR